MQTANFVTASAEITSITKIKKGDVYKRLEDGSTYSEDKIVHGIVLDVLYNGEDAAIQTMEFASSYKDLTTGFKVFGSKKDIKIFPSSMEEVQTYLKDCVKNIETELSTKQKEVLEVEDKLEQAKQIVSGELVKHLSTPEFSNEPVKQLEEVA